ncbi:hypothetical protein OROHE_007200 [Orobanche hederae]
MESRGMLFCMVELNLTGVLLTNVVAGSFLFATSEIMGYSVHI